MIAFVICERSERAMYPRPFALVAQLDRASVYGTEGRKFESSRARNFSSDSSRGSHLRRERVRALESTTARYASCNRCGYQRD